MNPLWVRMQVRKYAALTGLRGVGALAVLAYHMCLYLDVPSVHGVLLRGYFAVDMFFVLSGFVMANAYGHIFVQDRSARAYWRFLVRRLARLWPMHMLVLTAVLLAQLARHGLSAWPNQIVANVLMVQSWGLSQSIVIPDWSVSTEWAACLLFPLLAQLTLYSRWRSAVASLAAAVAILVSVMILARLQPYGRRGLLDIYEGWSLLPLGRCLAGAVIGMLLHRVTRLPSAKSWWGEPWVVPGAGILLVVGAVSGASDPVLYPLLPVLIGGLALDGRGSISRFLGSRLLSRVGQLSFAIYLVHQPLIDLMLHLGLRAWWPVLPVVVAIVASLAHVGVERPMRAWISNGVRLAVPSHNTA